MMFSSILSLEQVCVKSYNNSSVLYSIALWKQPPCLVLLFLLHCQEIQSVSQKISIIFKLHKFCFVSFFGVLVCHWFSRSLCSILKIFFYYYFCLTVILFVSAVAALVVRALLLYSLKCVVNNFGKGLKEQGW
mgnify:CR=1 FL=1